MYPLGLPLAAEGQHLVVLVCNELAIWAKNAQLGATGDIASPSSAKQRLTLDMWTTCASIGGARLRPVQEAHKVEGTVHVCLTG